jgi:thiol-disulfide isomerase/thioredoxin
MTSRYSFLIGLVLSFFIFFGAGATAQAIGEVSVYFFYGEGCPHCAKEKPFLEKLQARYDGVQVQEYEVWSNAENRQLLLKVGTRLGKNISGVPFTVIGTQTFSGYYSDETTGAEIQQIVDQCRKSGCDDPIASVISGITPEATNANSNTSQPEETKKIPETITVPLFGALHTEHFSLPLLTIIIAALDGFNPCAMWTLVFLIGLLLGMRDRKRMWILGGAFIGASALVYFLFLAAWLNLLLFLGTILWIRAAIGLIALGGGIYYLREYFTKQDATCKVTGQEQRRRILDRLKQFAQAKSFWLALGGIILLAMAVNLIELVCSAGLPAVYTQVLALSDLPRWQYYAYLLLYILIFLLDDLVVFFIAMKTLQVTGMTSKYARASHLLGGVVMLIVGLFLIFKPEVLMFG